MIDHPSYTHNLSSCYIITNSKSDQLPDGSLDSLVGRALHRYRSGHGFESRSGLNFIQALILQLLKLYV